MKRIFFALLFATVLVSLFAVSSAAGDEWLEYEDVFDSTNSVAIVRLSRSVTYYGEGDGFPETVPFDDFYLSQLVDGTISFFDSDEIGSIVEYAQNNSCTWLDLNCSVTLLYRKLNNESAVFPVLEATTFNCKSFHCFVSVFSGSNTGGLTSGQSFTYKYRVPGSSAWVEDSAIAVDDYVIISRYVNNISDGVYYTNSLAISELSSVFEFSASATNNFGQVDSPVLSFSFSNVYQYSIAAETGTESAPPEITSFNPGVDTVIPSDTMSGTPDELDGLIDDRLSGFTDDFTSIWNGFSWTKYASCFSFIGYFFNEFLFKLEPFKDIISAWAIFAVFNILLGGFITGVSAVSRRVFRDNKRSKSEAKSDLKHNHSGRDGGD